MSSPTFGPSVNTLKDVSRVVPGPNSTSIAVGRTQTSSIHLGSFTYPVVWVVIYALHTACAVYCFVGGMLFEYIPTTNAASNIQAYAVTLPFKYSHMIAVFHYFVGSLHAFFLAIALGRVLYRLYQRAVLRCKRNAVVQPTDPKTDSVLDRVTSSIVITVQRRTPWMLRMPVVVVYKHVFSHTGLFGVDFKYFDTFFLVREVVETVLQSLQAYQMTRLLTRPGLNRFFVGILVINCWATPILSHTVSSKPLKRLLERLCDAVLDFVASVGVPVAVVMNYIPVYDPTFKDFPWDLWFDDKWFVNILKESPIVFFGSWVDALSRLVFSIGLIASLDDIKQLLKRGHGVTFKSLRHLATNKPRSLRSEASRSTNDKHSRMVTTTHRLMFAYGFIVLALQLHADLRPSPMESCLLKVRPWGVTKPACSLVEVNCWRNRTLTGNANDFKRHIGALDPLSLTQITFRHCQHIEMQSTLEGFQNIIGIKFYNSTLASWDDDAALRQIHHAKMRFLLFLRTTIVNATLPAGVISPEFPLLLQDVEFSFTNLHVIPDDLDQRWPPGIGLLYEFSNVTTYPMVFTRTRFQSLRLYGNAITSVPAAAFEVPELEIFSLTGNPITDLPSNVNLSRVVALHHMEIDSTNVSVVPSWVETWILESFSYHYLVAGRTPWCEQVNANATKKATELWLKRVSCKDYGPDYGYYPYEVDERPDEIW